MTVEIAHDAWIGGVEYFFECLSDSSHSSEWQQGSDYVVSGLDPKTEFCFQVKAKDALGNETHYSDPCCASCDIVDSTHPVPAPDLRVVDANAPNSIRLVASESFDISGVEYYFENRTIVDRSHDSGWLTFEGVMPSYIDVNLMAETQYCYRVMARDKSVYQNATDWSDTVCRTTPEPPDDTPPAPVPPGPIVWDPSLQDVNCTQCNGEPRDYWFEGDPKLDWWVVMRPDPSIRDDSPGPLEFYFECEAGLYSSDHTHPETGGWISFPQGGSLDPETGYVGYWYKVKVGYNQRELEFKFKVRDEWGIESEWSPAVKTHWF
jgi:hypothetical protein